MNDPTSLVLSIDEQQHFAELREVLSTANTPGFARIMKRLEELADEGLEEMIGKGGAPDMVLEPMARRWIQRTVMVRDIKGYIASCQTEKDQILKSIEQERSSNAEQD